MQSRQEGANVVDERLRGMRIAILVQNLPVPFDRRVWQEATTLQRAGAEVIVVCPDDARHPAGEFTIEGVHVYRYCNPPEASGVVGYVREYGISLWRMRHALRKARNDFGAFGAVHFCNPPDMLYAVAKPFKRSDRSILVFDQHDLGPELVKAKSLPLGWFFIKVAEFFERRTYRAADHVISTNESYRSIAMSRGGFSNDSATVVRSGPSRSWATESVESRDWHEGAKYLLGYLGVMGTQEGIEYLLDAVKILIGRGLDVRLALVGSGPDRDRLERYAVDIGVGDRVTFHGRVSDDTLRSILSDADVCVNPDEVNPMNDLSTMNKIIEYMALGRPIVQFDVKEGRFSAGDASLYATANDAVSFADRVGQVLGDAKLASSMAEAGRQRFVEVLSWERQGEILVDTYQSLISR